MLPATSFHVDCAAFTYLLRHRGQCPLRACPGRDRVSRRGHGSCAVLDEYVGYYHQHHPNRARNLRPPDRDDITMTKVTDVTTARMEAVILSRRLFLLTGEPTARCDRR